MDIHEYKGTFPDAVNINETLEINNLLFYFIYIAKLDDKCGT